MFLLGQAGCGTTGYQRHGFVPEIHHGVVGDKGIHKADHVVSAETLLLRGNLVGDDVQALVHLGKRREEKSLSFTFVSFTSASPLLLPHPSHPSQPLLVSGTGRGQAGDSRGTCHAQAGQQESCQHLLLPGPSCLSLLFVPARGR